MAFVFFLVLSFVLSVASFFSPPVAEMAAMEVAARVKCAQVAAMEVAAREKCTARVSLAQDLAACWGEVWTSNPLCRCCAGSRCVLGRGVDLESLLWMTMSRSCLVVCTSNPSAHGNLLMVPRSLLLVLFVSLRWLLGRGVDLESFLRRTWTSVRAGERCGLGSPGIAACLVGRPHERLFLSVSCVCVCPFRCFVFCAACRWSGC